MSTLKAPDVPRKARKYACLPKDKISIGSRSLDLNAESVFDLIL